MYKATFNLSDYSLYSALPSNLIGVYSIENTSTGHVYVGSSANLIKRWWAHKHFMQKGVHGNDLLQEAYNRNPDNWVFKIHLTTDSTDDLLDLEYLVGMEYDRNLLCNHMLGTVEIKRPTRKANVKRGHSLRARNSVPRWADYSRTTIHLH